jgi:hypothetical protein
MHNIRRYLLSFAVSSVVVFVATALIISINSVSVVLLFTTPSLTTPTVQAPKEVSLTNTREYDEALAVSLEDSGPNLIKSASMETPDKVHEKLKSNPTIQ